MLSFVIIEPGEFGHVGFLVDDLHFLDHVCGNILGGRLHVFAKEFLAVNTHGGNTLAVDGDIALLVHSDAVHFLEQILHHGILADLVGGGVVFDCIAFDCHLRGVSLYLHFR